MQILSTEEEWQKVADNFEKKWDFPHCVGAIDGKHVVIQKPGKSGSMFYNYKGTFSIILMAIVDADYKFIYADVGAAGSLGDAAVFNKCKISSMLESNELAIPDDDLVTGIDVPLPYMLVGDDAFPLRNYLMKPFRRRNLSNDEIIFNYRLSRARRVVENAFGILANRFRVFRTPIALQPKTAKTIVLASIALHNLLQTPRKTNTSHERDVELMPFPTVTGLRELRPNRRIGRQSDTAKEIREKLVSYFVSDGKVPWQYKMVGLPNPV